MSALNKSCYNSRSLQWFICQFSNVRQFSSVFHAHVCSGTCHHFLIKTTGGNRRTHR